MIENVDGPGHDRLSRAVRAAKSEAQRPFDLADEEPLVRFRLIRFGPEDSILVLTFHHAVMDACAWLRKNVVQVWRPRWGTGSMPVSLRIFQTVEGATLMPRTASSPWMCL
jgi:hypothetical protein